MNRACTISLGCLLLASAAAAQTPAFELTVRNVMRGPELVGSPPDSLAWSADSRWLYFVWKPGGRPWHEQPARYRVGAGGGAPELVNDTAWEAAAVAASEGERSHDGRWRAVAREGDLFLVEARTGSVRRLTQTRAVEASPTFSADDRTLYYVADNNVYAHDLQNGQIRQLTDVRTGPAPVEDTAVGQRRYLEQQQLELFEHIRIEEARRLAAETRRREEEARGPLRTLYLERGERVAAIAVDPAARYVFLSTARAQTAEPRIAQVPFWVTRSGYTEPRPARTKVGDFENPAGRLGVLSLATGEVRWLDIAQAGADSASVRSRAITTFLGWNRAGTTGLVVAVSAIFKDAWIWSVDAATGRLTLLLHERNADESWLQGPCQLWLCTGWLPDDRTVYFVSERDGYAHLYTVPASGGTPRQLTSGNFEVQTVAISPQRDRFHLHTTEGSPFEWHFYRMNFDGSGRTRITTSPGRQDVTVSPDGRRLGIVHSTANQPPELYLAENEAGAPMRRITTSPTADWQAFPWIRPEIVHVPAQDGAQVPARIYRPADVGAQPNGAAVIFVHGAGYLQNVHNWWSTYYREYMFHHVLASKGYVVLDMDFRGSSGYGRDWRTAIYRHMGGKDLTDHLDGARWLNQQFGIDHERIGIYGGSYGGFITLMALFTEPKLFGAGAALRSVTDWAHYNQWYTSRILNLPQDDTLAYRRSSPIYFAEGLEDPLLIAHGMVDVNVHFSDVVRLVQRLIELGKEDWELAVYPVEDHAFVQPTSWADEYRRILELFEESLR